MRSITISKNIVPTSAKLNIIVAHDPEAQPLVKAWQLKPWQQTPFKIYRDDNAEIYLMISGSDPRRIACAMGYLYGVNHSNRHSCFLNMGIAGADAPLGSVFLAHRLLDVTSGQFQYPSSLLFAKFPTQEIHTHSQPCDHYQAGIILDMEASHFFSNASQFVTKEHIAILKVISDNPQAKQQNVSKDQAKQLITDALSTITDLKEQLLTISYKQQPKNDHQLFKRFIEHWHFSQYQQHQLRILLHQWQLSDSKDAFKTCESLTTAKAVMNTLEHTLSQCSNL